MGIDQAWVLALVQGLTEFLPISSSAHLVLVPILTNWDDQGVAFDVAVHVGTLAAVMAYFRAELRAMSGDFIRSCLERRLVGESKLMWWVLLATVPAGVAGLLLKFTGLDDAVRNLWVIVVTTLVFGVLLGYADRRANPGRHESSLTLQEALWIGAAQAIALLPGTSRSGITITAALLIGLAPNAAARFSFLLSIPIIMLAGGVETLKLVQQGVDTHWLPILIGVGVSFVSAYMTIHFFLKLLSRIGMMPFVYYRLALGIGLLGWGVAAG